MNHEDGYCDRCGAELDAAAPVTLTVDGEEHCPSCAAGGPAVRATKPEARDDGR